MILYNVTVKIDKDVEAEWLQWMKEDHIPEVMDTGLFTENKLCRLLSIDDPDGTTYAIQFFCIGLDEFILYQEKYAPGLQEKHSKLFKGKFVIFRTLMEVL